MTYDDERTLVTCVPFAFYVRGYPQCISSLIVKSVALATHSAVYWRLSFYPYPLIRFFVLFIHSLLCLLRAFFPNDIIAKKNSQLETEKQKPTFHLRQKKKLLLSRTSKIRKDCLRVWSLVTRLVNPIELPTAKVSLARV